MLVPGLAMLLKNRDSFGGSCNVICFIHHAYFYMTSYEIRHNAAVQPPSNRDEALAAGNFSIACAVVGR